MVLDPQGNLTGEFAFNDGDLLGHRSTRWSSDGYPMYGTDLPVTSQYGDLAPRTTLLPDGSALHQAYDQLFAVGMDGTLRWTYASDGAIRSQPVVGLDGITYVMVESRGLVAVDAQGTELWADDSFVTNGADFSVAVDAQRIYTLQAGSDLRVYDLQTHQPEWSYQLGGGNFGPALGSDGEVYVSTVVGGWQAALVAIDKDGGKLWDRALDNEMPFANPIVDAAGRIYCAAGLYSDPAAVYCYSHDGTRLWDALLEHVPSELALGADGTLYVTEQYGGMSAFAR